MKKSGILLKLLVCAGLIFSVSLAWAQGSSGAPAGSIGEVAGVVTQSFENLAKLITAISYVAGMGFAIGAILKFKAHKDNPAQIPVGTPIAMLFIAAALIFLPTIFAVVGDTLFGTSIQQQTGGPQGVATFTP